MQILLRQNLDVHAFKELPDSNADLLWNEYTEEEVQDIVEALEFAADHPHFDFVGLIPTIRHSNQDIHLFLCKILRSIQNAAQRRSLREIHCTSTAFGS